MMNYRLKNLEVPSGRIDVVLDTDTYNEIDDQFALSYMVRSDEKLNVKAIYAAPFFNRHSSSPKDGMEKSYLEILKLLKLLKAEIPTYKGSENYLKDENSAVDSPAANDLVERAKNYSSENPLYVVAIGAITNVASAIIKAPEIIDNIVVVWLGGHAHHYTYTGEFNMRQDYAAARVVMKSGVAFVQLPAVGVVDHFTVSRVEFEKYFLGRNELSDYLASYTISQLDYERNSDMWSKVVWDVTAIGWLLNDDNRFMQYRIIPTKIPTYEGYYADVFDAPFMSYIYVINRDALFKDLVEKLTK